MMYVWLQDRIFHVLYGCMVLRCSVCGVAVCLVVCPWRRAAGILTRLGRRTVHVHAPPLSVWDISLVQVMAGVQGQHRGHALESSHSHMITAPQSLKLAFFFNFFFTCSSSVFSFRGYLRGRSSFLPETC